MSKKKILIVEDEAIISMNIQSILEMKGYGVIGIASSGKEAVELTEMHSPDLILMDIILNGEMDGITAYEKIKEKHDIPIIYCTAHSNEKTLNRAKATEPHGYLIKPINTSELFSAIEIALYKHEMEMKMKLRESKKELQAEKESYKALMSGLDATGLGVDIVDTDYRVLFQNDVLKKRFGDLTGKLCYENYMGLDVPCTCCPMKKAIASGSVEIVELTASDGREYELVSAPLQNPDGTIDSVAEVVHDITERKLAEERLKKVNECLVSLGSIFMENINRLTAMCGELLEGDCALYNRLESGMLCSRGQWKTPPDYNPVDKPDGHICYDVILRGMDDVFLIRNLHETKYAHTDPNVKAYNLKTYIARPVKCDDDYVGSLCVVFQKDIDPDDNEKMIIGILASAIGKEEERKKAEEELKSSLREKEILLKEVHHRVKNNFQVISSLLSLQSRQFRDEHDIELFNDTKSRIYSMSLVHEKLYKSDDLADINFSDYVQALISAIAQMYNTNAGSVKAILNVKDMHLGIDMAIPCALILNELVSNSYKHAFPEGKRGKITLKFSSDKSGNYKLTISDNGIGLPKEMDFRKTESLGMQLVSFLVKQLNGSIEQGKGKGTRFTITFPVE